MPFPDLEELQHLDGPSFRKLVTIRLAAAQFRVDQMQQQRESEKRSVDEALKSLELLRGEIIAKLESEYREGIRHGAIAVTFLWALVHVLWSILR